MKGQENMVNIKLAGLGGMGVLKASDILADAVFLAGHDVKKSEVHGMAQRGGAISSDVRFGTRTLSPMIPLGRADYLVLLAADQLDAHRHQLRSGGVLLSPEDIEMDRLTNRKALNVAMLGALSRHLDMDPSVWKDAIYRNLPERLHAANDAAFALGRAGKP